MLSRGLDKLIVRMPFDENVERLADEVAKRVATISTEKNRK